MFSIGKIKQNISQKKPGLWKIEHKKFILQRTFLASDPDNFPNYFQIIIWYILLFLIPTYILNE